MANSEFISPPVSPMDDVDAKYERALAEIIGHANSLAACQIPHVRMLGIRVAALTQSLLDSVVLESGEIVGRGRLD